MSQTTPAVPKSRAKELLDRRLLFKFLAVAVMLLLLPYYHRYYSARLLKLTPGDPRDGMPIKTLIRQVKEQLYETELEMRERRENAMFEVKTFDLEISFVVHTDTKTGAELLAVSGEAHAGFENAHKITLHLAALERPETHHTVGPSTITRTPDIVVK